MNRWHAVRALAWLCLLQATGGAWAQQLLDFSAAERAQIAAHGPWPGAHTPDHSNRAAGRAAAVAWGRQLFFSKALSADGQVACADCHQPARAFQDNRPVAQARPGGPEGTRNTPSLLDVAGQRWYGWDGAHDNLWSASRAPLLKPDEMGWTVAALAARLRGHATWVAARAHALGPRAPVDDEGWVVDAAKALAAFQATLRSPRTPFDEFRDALTRGDRARAGRYPMAAQRGLRLFIGKGRCSVCHAGPRFSNGEFADVGVPFFVPGGADPGRHGGLQAVMVSPYNRLGPHSDAAADDPQSVPTRHLVQQPRHFGEFRVPGLRQLAHTAPYMHNGSLATIEDVVRHYSALNEERLHADGERILRRLDLTAEESADLAAFLRSLSR